jgi:hypothetical protein
LPRAFLLVRTVVDQLTEVFDGLSIELRSLHLVLRVYVIKRAKWGLFTIAQVKGGRFRRRGDEKRGISGPRCIEERAYSFRQGISPCACPYVGTVDGISAVDN